MITGLDAVGSVTGELAGIFAYLALVVGATLTLLGLGLVMAATACALVELDAGRSVGPTTAYRLAFRRIRPLLGAIAIFVGDVGGAHDDRRPHPRRAVARGAVGAARSGRRARGADGRSERSAAAPSSSVAAGSASARSSCSARLLALAAGPLVGALLIFVSNSSLALLNLVAGIVYAIALPFVALVTCYVYFDARARHELDPPRPGRASRGDRARAITRGQRRGGPPAALRKGTSAAGLCLELGPALARMRRNQAA